MTTDTATSQKISSRKTRSVIRVTFHANTKSLTIEPRVLEARPGGRVVWRFVDPPRGYEPVIQFPTTTATSSQAVFETGPFETLCLAPGGITGVIADDAAGRHPYVVTFVPRPGVNPPDLDLTVPPPAAIHIGVDGEDEPQSAGG